MEGHRRSWKVMEGHGKSYLRETDVAPSPVSGGFVGWPAGFLFPLNDKASPLQSCQSRPGTKETLALRVRSQLLGYVISEVLT